MLKSKHYFGIIYMRTSTYVFKQGSSKKKNEQVNYILHIFIGDKIEKDFVLWKRILK